MEFRKQTSIEATSIPNCRLLIAVILPLQFGGNVEAMGQIRRVIPLSDFIKNLDIYIGELSSAPEPLMITRRGRALFIVQDPDSFAENSDLAEHARHHLWSAQQNGEGIE